MSVKKYKEEAIRDAFISGLRFSVIRLRLLENKTLQLQNAFDQPLTLDVIQKSSESYASETPSFSDAIENSNNKCAEVKEHYSDATQAVVAAVRV